jgi:hypothetical protein
MVSQAESERSSLATAQHETPNTKHQTRFSSGIGAFEFGDLFLEHLLHAAFGHEHLGDLHGDALGRLGAG